MEALAEGADTGPDVQQRIRLDLAYAGTYFHGWAAQPELRTVEGSIADALNTVLRRPATLTVAGRTDTGVHAANQVAHFDLNSQEWGRYEGELATLMKRLQGLINRDYSALWQTETVRKVFGRQETRDTSDLVLKKLVAVPETFDARFSASGRQYCYRVATNPEHYDPSRRTDILWSRSGSLDADAVRKGADLLVGEHDFLSFCRPREGATTIRTLREIRVVNQNDHWELWFHADAFCHSMVRSLVGALMMVGNGQRNPGWVSELLAEPARTHGVPVAPARGLTLENVDYPEPSQWADRARVARQRRDAEPCCS